MDVAAIRFTGKPSGCRSERRSWSLSPGSQPSADAVDLLARHGFATVALSPGGATPLADLRRLSRIAVLLGAEGPGLAADILTATPTVRIPMAKDFDSLNVATTSGIVLHHLMHVAK